MTTRTLSRRTRYLFSALKVDGRTATTAVTNFNFNNLSAFFLCFFSSSSSSYVFPSYPEKKFPYLDDYAYRIKFASDSVKSKFDDFNPPRQVSNIQQELDNCYYKGNCIESSSELRRYRLVTMCLQGTEIDTQEELFDFYIKVLANAMGIGETEAMRKIYLVSCGEFYGFGAEFDRVAFRNLHCRNGVTSIVPDTYYHARKIVPNVQSALQFTPLNRYLRLDNIFSYYHLSEPNSKGNSDHWLITIKHVGGREVSEFCVKMLAAIVGSEKAALEKIYIIWFESPFGFGAEIDEATSNKLRDLADVLTVLPDYAFDIKAKIGFNPDPLNVFCYSYGLRVRYFHMSEEYDSRDWLISKEEQVVVFGDSTYSHALQSVPQFTPINRDHILNNIFSYHHFSKGNPEWNSDHWLIHIKRPDNEFPTEQETVDICIQLLAKILGRIFRGAVQRTGEDLVKFLISQVCERENMRDISLEKEAKKKIYVVWCKMPFGFGAEIDEESSIKLKDLSNVLVVLPDYAFDVKNRNRGVLVISASSYLEPGNPRVKRFPLLVPEFVDDFADSEDS